MFFQLLTNGWLTGRDIVTYDPGTILGLRVVYAPVEDLLFGFTLVVQSMIWVGVVGSSRAVALTLERARRYHAISTATSEASMSDVLIRDVPEDVLTVIDARAAALRLSRNEYLRRRLRQETQLGAGPVHVDDLQRFAAMFSDLADAEVMSRAWS